MRTIRAPYFDNQELQMEEISLDRLIPEGIQLSEPDVK
jgi:hypothetical protein